MSRAVAAALTADRDYGTARDPHAVAERAAAVLETARWPSPATHMVLGSLGTLRLDRGDGLDLDVVERRRRLEPTLRGAGLLPPSTDSADALTAYVSTQLGDPAASLSRLPALVEAADRAGEEFAGFAFRVHLATAHQACGDFAASRRVLAEAGEHRGRVPAARFPPLLPVLVTQAMADDSTAAAAEVITRETSGLEDGPARWQVVVAHLTGLCALDEGRAADALAAFERALAVARAIGIEEPGRRFLVDVAVVESHLALGDLDRAEVALRDLDAFARPRRRANVVAALDRLTGVLHARHGDLDRAETELVAAVARAADLPFRTEHARTTADLAEVLILRGDLRGAAATFDTARALLVAMPFAAGVAALDRRRRELGTTDDPNALTPAERAVVDAVVAGATARQAGENLAVSHRTVEAHLRAVYRKLGVRGRVELTALALRGELDRRA